MKGKYEKAAETYQNAFSHIKYPFKKDIDFALKCEMNSRRDTDNIKKYIWLLVNKNEDKDQFLNDSIYYDLSNWNEIKYMIDTTLPSVNFVLIDTIKNIYISDQTVRRNRKKYVNDSSFFSARWVVDSINYDRIVLLLKEYPVISEELIGADGWEKMHIVPWHSSHRLKINIQLFQSLVDGKLDARKYTHLLQNSYFLAYNEYAISNWFSSDIVCNFDDFNLPPYLYMPKQKNIRSITKYLKRLYMEDHMTFHNKRLWQFKNRISDDMLLVTSNIAFADNDYYFKTIEDKKNKIYYRSKEDKKNINKAMKEYYKNNLKNDTDTK